MAPRLENRPATDRTASSENRSPSGCFRVNDVTAGWKGRGSLERPDLVFRLRRAATGERLSANAAVHFVAWQFVDARPLEGSKKPAVAGPVSPRAVPQSAHRLKSVLRLPVFHVSRADAHPNRPRKNDGLSHKSSHGLKILVTGDSGRTTLSECLHANIAPPADSARRPAVLAEFIASAIAVYF